MELQSNSQCHICIPDHLHSKTISLIIFKLIKIIQKNNINLKHPIEPVHQQSFKNLIDYAGLQIEQNLTSLRSCPHKSLKIYIAKKLEINFEQLHEICEKVYNALSKRKFQLEMVEKISKQTYEQVMKNSKAFKIVQSSNHIKNAEKLELQLRSQRKDTKSFSNSTGDENPQKSQRQHGNEIIQQKNVQVLQSGYREIFPFFNFNNQSSYSSMYYPMPYGNQMFDYRFSNMGNNFENQNYSSGGQSENQNRKLS